MVECPLREYGAEFCPDRKRLSKQELEQLDQQTVLQIV